MQLIVERDGPVVTLTINRPEVMNAMTREMYADLTDTLRAMDRDDGVHAVVITGAGDRAFSSGADLRLFHSPEDATSPWRPWSANRWDLGAAFTKPLIAAINGYAVAGGLELALVCDIRIATPNAQFGAPEIKWGLLGPVDTYYLPRAVGISNAMLMLMTGRFIDAAEALRTGLISEIVPAGELLTRARTIASEISAHPPETVRMVKEMALRGLDLTLEAHMRFSEALEKLTDTSAERASRLSGFGKAGS